MTDNTTEQIRSLKIDEVDPEEGTFRGVFAPYDEIVTYDGKQERYERGLFEGADLVDLYYNHGRIERGGDMPIGEVIEYAETETGAEIVGRFFTDTARGAEAYSLTKAGRLNALSAGFVPVQVRQDDDVTVWEKAHLNEVSLVKRPAYPSAQISQVRSANTNNSTKESVEETTHTQHNMSNENNYDDSEIRSELDSVKRELAVVRESGNKDAAAGSQYRSAGEFIKGLANGDDSAKAEVRAFVGADGAKLSDSHTSNDWKNELLRIVDKGRPVLNLFDRGPLGAQGNSVEFPKVNSITGDVAVQANEGDNLAYIEVGLTTATAPVRTYGGYSELSRQAIERSDVAYLDAVLRAQAASYGKVTNGAVRTALAAATPQAGASFTLSSATAANFVGAVVDGVRKIDANGVLATTADFVLVSADVYDKLAGLFDNAGRPMFDINRDGSNTIGSLNIGAINGSVAGKPVVMDAGLPAKTLYVASSAAVQTWESAGAPLRLQDENIIALTKQFSLYGYMAVGVKDANGLVKATIA